MAKKFFSVFLICLLVCVMVSEHSVQGLMVTSDKANKDYIKWVDFDIIYEALEDAMNVDIETYEQDLHVSWVDILAFLACKYGGDFSMYSHKDIDWFVETPVSYTHLDVYKRQP